jgi:hypothetical protein
LYNQGKPAFDKLHYGQFFETVVLRSIRPCVPAGMPVDYALLMRQCQVGEPGERPPVAKLLACLDIMIAEREQALALRLSFDSSASGRATSAAHQRALDALVALLQPEQAQVQAILQQQQQHVERRSAELLSPERRSAERLSAERPRSVPDAVISNSLLYADGGTHTAGGATGLQAAGVVIGEGPQQQQAAPLPPQQQQQRTRPARTPRGSAEGQQSLDHESVSTSGPGNRLWFV